MPKMTPMPSDADRRGAWDQAQRAHQAALQHYEKIREKLEAESRGRFVAFDSIGGAFAVADTRRGAIAALGDRFDPSQVCTFRIGD